MASKCTGCGAEFPDDSEYRRPGKPCPNCGETNRAVQEVPLVASIRFHAVTLTIENYYDLLLKLAKQLLDEGRFQVSIVVAHMACEACTEIALKRAFAAKGVPPYLQEVILGFLTGSGYSPMNGRVQCLYNTFTGRQIQRETTFWEEFTQSANRRNAIVHRAKTATKPEAEHSLAVVTNVITYLMTP